LDHHTGFWRYEQDALLSSYHGSISQLEARLSQASRGIYSTQQVSLRADGSEGCSGVALLDSQGSDGGLLAFGLARQMLQSCRWVMTSSLSHVHMRQHFTIIFIFILLLTF